MTKSIFLQKWSSEIPPFQIKKELKQNALALDITDFPSLFSVLILLHVLISFPFRYLSSIVI
ncbi:hypothetical protein, partial [Aeromonas caviae]|uniref:hypothetical protein n=1 Tax=Aeromonas caviae TaxID=648 RepID=UPI001C570041